MLCVFVLCVVCGWLVREREREKGREREREVFRQSAANAQCALFGLRVRAVDVAGRGCWAGGSILGPGLGPKTAQSLGREIFGGPVWAATAQSLGRERLVEGWARKGPEIGPELGPRIFRFVRLGRVGRFSAPGWGRGGPGNGSESFR